MSTTRLPPPRPQRETLICLHSSASSGRQWRELVAPLESRFEVLTPNLLGYDEPVAWPAGRAASLDDEARQLAPLLDARPGGVHLLGHSFGAAVALQMALRRPSRIKSLTLYEPVRFALLTGEPATMASAADVTRFGRAVGMATRSGRHHDAAEMFVDYWSGDGTWRSLTARQQQGLALRMPKVRAEFEALFGDPMPVAAYRLLTMPVHLLGGERSPAPAARVLDRLASALPNARLVRLAGLGHMGPIDDPQRVREALPEWLWAPDATTMSLAEAGEAIAATALIDVPHASALQHEPPPSPRRHAQTAMLPAAVLAALVFSALWFGAGQRAVAVAPAEPAAAVTPAAGAGRDPSVPDAASVLAGRPDIHPDHPPIATF